MMGRSGTWPRLVVLALLGLCVGGLSVEAPSTAGPAGAAQLVLADAGAPSALPAPTWTVAIEVGGGPPPRVARRSAAAPPPPAAISGDAPARGSDADRPGLRSGAFLLGLLAAPANAPPRS
jgi:hypothetical protein